MNLLEIIADLKEFSSKIDDNIGAIHIPRAAKQDFLSHWEGSKQLANGQIRISNGQNAPTYAVTDELLLKCAKAVSLYNEYNRLRKILEDLPIPMESLSKIGASEEQLDDTERELIIRKIKENKSLTDDAEILTKMLASKEARKNSGHVGPFKQVTRQQGDQWGSALSTFIGTLAADAYPHKITATLQGHPELVEKLMDYKINKTIDYDIAQTTELIDRLLISLLTKPFLILTGLSGSGKSRAAKQFARAFSKGDLHYHFAAVGPDWNNRDPLLGYPDGIHSAVYQSTPVLELLIKAGAKENEKKPFFLILDEMNLSHVERYFADFLSAMESDEEISLYEGDDRKTTPKTIIIPPNLFIIGTVNIDETTYQFSPKVLDRANVIEFKMNEGDVEKFFARSAEEISPGAMEEFAEQFVVDAQTDDKVAVDWASGNETFKTEMQALFDLLKEFNGEFGYRTLKESSRYLYFHDKYSDLKDEEKYRDAMDHIIIQKLLPKLHGSRSKLEGILRALLYFCESPERTDMEELKTKALTAAAETNTSLDMLGSAMEGYYKLSHSKLRRMCRKLHQDQFVSFADA
jgi:MoxR-like ATPase